jgi:hypothetical protein
MFGNRYKPFLPDEKVAQVGAVGREFENAVRKVLERVSLLGQFQGLPFRFRSNIASIK